MPVDGQNFYVLFSVLLVLVWGGRLSFGRMLIAICEGGWYVPSEIGFLSLSAGPTKVTNTRGIPRLKRGIDHSDVPYRSTNS